MAKTLGLLGRKLGMTRIFADDGTVVPVTVISAGHPANITLHRRPKIFFVSPTIISLSLGGVDIPLVIGVLQLLKHLKLPSTL